MNAPLISRTCLDTNCYSRNKYYNHFRENKKIYVLFLRHRLTCAVLVFSCLAPGACVSVSIYKAVGVAPLAAIYVDSRRPAAPFERLTFVSVARWNLALAAFTIKALNSDALSMGDFGPLLIPVAYIQLKVPFPDPPGEQVYLVVCQPHPAQSLQCCSVSLNQQAALSGAVNLNASGTV